MEELELIAVNDSLADDRYRVQKFSAILFSTSLNAATLLTALLLLAILLRTPTGRRWLAPRLDASPAFPFGWIRLALSRQQIRDDVGLDGLVVIRFLDLGFKFCLFGSFLSIVLVPMYAFSENTENLGKFTRFSLTNIDKEKLPWKFHVVVVCAYLLNAAFMYFMVGEWRSFRALRRKHFKETVAGNYGPGSAQAIRSILVENIPKELRSAQQLFQYFERHFGEGSVHSVVVQSDTRPLHHVDSCCWRTSRRRQAEAMNPDVSRGIELSTLAGRRRRSTVVDESSPLAGVNLPEAARDFSQKLQNYTISLASTVSKAIPVAELVKPSSCSTGFVTFELVQTRVMSEHVLLSHSSDWRIRSAPESRDIVWRNAPVPWKLTYARGIVAQCLCVVGVVFWSVPVTTIQLLSNARSLRQLLPGVFALSQHWSKLFRTLLVKYVPVVALILLLALLPIIFEAGARRYERYKVKSDVHRTVLNRYMGYLLATLYVAVVSGSVSGTLETIIHNPPKALDEVREAVPSVAVYFITFVLARIGITIPILLFYPSLRTAASCYFPTEAADAALVLVLGLTYSAIAPLILIACAAYFAIASIVYRWLFLYVYEQEFDCAGSFWYDLFSYSIWGLFFSNVTLMALAGGHTCLNSAGFYATAVLPLATLLFKAFCEQRFARPTQSTALEDAVEADCLAEANDIELDENYYVDPVLKEPQLRDAPELFGMSFGLLT